MFIMIVQSQDISEYADGYYPFEEGPGLTPPTARKPPYTQTNGICAGLVKHGHGNVSPSFHNTLCGDLNLGVLPQNPMGQSPLGHTYPFELIKNKTLEYLSETLPLLKGDNSIPKVAKFQGQIMNGAFPRKRRKRNEMDGTVAVTERLTRSDVVTGRGLCDGSDGILCRMFSTFFPQRSGQPITLHRNDNLENNDLMTIASSTPCPSKAEYATPIFAKNYQGLWRYVVQIPYEDYLMQTVEVTRCLQGKCHFMDGHCLSSPRWVSLLVAEIFYPNALFPTTPALQRTSTSVPPFDMPAVSSFQDFQHYLHRRNGFSNPSSPDKTPETHDYCDGYDQIGCLQIRLFQDWFLVPGACKCWKGLSRNVFLNN